VQISAAHRDDIAYVVPMTTFLVFTQAGVTWPNLYVVSYIAKTLIVPVGLLIWWRSYTKINWTHVRLGVIVGVIGVVQWVGTDKLLAHFFQWSHSHGPYLDWVPVYGSIGVNGVPTDSFSPFLEIQNVAARYEFIALRWMCASLIVPVMEELFWRDYLWRTIAAAGAFKLVRVGEADPTAFVVVTLAFSTVHTQWISAIVWGLLIGLLLIRTKSLGSCIVGHGVTNFLLGAYVLYTHEWYFW
jgi:membrane protease YdiL (CAAX protease family)